VLSVAGRIHIGTSGWNYPSWRGPFYEGRPARSWLAFCAARFGAVEVNATFYRLQSVATFRRWRDATPAGFRFAIKANRYLTHSRRLIDPAPAIRLERDRASALGAKLGAVVWQLPAHFHRNLPRLDAFVRALRFWRVPHAIEFRHPSWFDDAVADCLRARNIAVCQSDAADWPLWECVTADMVYVRLHGHEVTYASRYSDADLRRWARRLRRWAGEGRDVHVYFDNDAGCAAPFDALRLAALVS